MKKIVILLPKLNAGGTERTCVELANFLAQQEIEVTVLLMYNFEHFYSLDSRVKVLEPIDLRKKYGRFFYLPFLFCYINKSLKKIQPDTVLCLGYILFGLIASYGIHSRIIISGRSSPTRVRFPGNFLANKIYELGHKLYSKKVNGIIAQTNEAKKVYQSKYICPIVVIPNFLRKINTYPTHTREKIIITVGRCVFEKGQHSLIEAFSMLKDKSWKLQIIGDGPLRKELEKKAITLNCADRVEFLGFQKEVDYFLSKAQIFAFTSIIEGYPNALIEGMAHGLAPISFDCSAGPSDIIENDVNGFLVPVNDITLFAEKLNDLISDDLLRLKFQREAIKVLEKNDLKTIAKRYQDFLFA